MRIGDYVVVGELGRGAMGTVYLAESTDGTRVAVKTLPRLDTDSAQRMRHEISALRRVSHPSIVQIQDVGETPDGRPYLAMDYLPGGSLLDILNRYGPLSPGATAFVLCDLAQALAALHAGGVVHRDIKPSNVLLREDGSPCLADLGIALVAGASRLTATGDMIGTLGYTAPEVQEGASPSPASDVFSLGVLGYHLLAGRPPFEGESVAAVIRACAEGRHAPLPTASPTAPPALTRAIESAMAHDPASRPADLRGWAHEMRNHVAFQTVPTVPSVPTPIADEPTREVARGGGQGVLALPGSDETVSRKKRNVALVAVAAIVVLLVSATAAWAAFRNSESTGETAAEDDTAVEDAELRVRAEQREESTPIPPGSQDTATTVPAADTASTTPGTPSGESASSGGAPQGSSVPEQQSSSAGQPAPAPAPPAPNTTATTKPRDPADFNADGYIDGYDLQHLCNHWGETGSALPWDLNQDGTVNVFDMSILLARYKPGPTAPPADQSCN